MWKIEFFILPSSNYHDISENEAYEFGEKVEYLDRMDELLGKMATVKFFTYSRDMIPTQPVMKCIRDYE